MPDRFDKINLRAGQISVGIQEVGAYISDLDAVLGETERSLSVALHRTELPQSLQDRLAILKYKLTGLRDEIVAKIHHSGELIKTGDAIGDAPLHDFKANGDRLIALARRLNAALDQIELELSKPVEVVEETN